MDLKNKAGAAAVIDIGSNSLRLEIAQVMGGEIRKLESLVYPVSLGRDTFSSKRISFEKVNKTCEILQNFLTAAEGYGIKRVRAVATTAVREAENKDFVLEQIKLRCGLNVRVLDDSAEKTLIFREIIRRYKDIKEYKNPALMAYIGVGNLGVALYDKGMVPFTQNIRIGSLRLSELFLNMQEYEEQYSNVIEDYLRGFTETFYATLPKGDIKHLIASGRDIKMIARLCGGDTENAFCYIDRDRFNSLYEDLKNKTIEQIMEDYNLQQESADLLRSAMSIYNMLLRATTADKIIAPIVFISDAILYDELMGKESQTFRKEFEQNSVLSAKAVALKYNYDDDHARYVEKYSLKLFDKTKKIHGLSSRERLYLQVAAILHDVGKFINITAHYEHSYNIVRSTEIVGFDLHETEIIANIVKYHSTRIPSMLDNNYNRLSEKDRMTVAKLTALLRIAEALDKGHIKKFDDIDVKIKNNTMVIGISTYNNTQIEEWSFDMKKLYFEEVYAMRAVIKKKKVM